VSLPTATFLPQADRDQIQADAEALFVDARVIVPVTYRDFLGETFDPETGVKARTYTDLALNAIRNAVPAREVQAAAGLYATGDLQFTLVRRLLGAITPTRDDLLVDGTTTYDLISWDSDPLGLLWRIVARKVGT